MSIIPERYSGSLYQVKVRQIVFTMMQVKMKLSKAQLEAIA